MSVKVHSAFLKVFWVILILMFPDFSSISVKSEMMARIFSSANNKQKKKVTWASVQETYLSGLSRASFLKWLFTMWCQNSPLCEYLINHVFFYLVYLQDDRWFRLLFPGTIFTKYNPMKLRNFLHGNGDGKWTSYQFSLFTQNLL